MHQIIPPFGGGKQLPAFVSDFSRRNRRSFHAGNQGLVSVQDVTKAGQRRPSAVDNRIDGVVQQLAGPARGRFVTRPGLLIVPTAILSKWPPRLKIEM